MPGVTTLGIRYPLPGEVVDQAAWENLASDVDSLMAATATRRSTARAPQFGEVTGNLSAAVGVSTTPTFNTEEEDNGGLIDLGVSNDRITVGTGVWLVHSAAVASGMTTMTQFRIGFSVNGTLHTARKLSTITVSPGAAQVMVMGLVSALTVGTILRANVLWNGTGGPAVGTIRLWALKIRDL